MVSLHSFRNVAMKELQLTDAEWYRLERPQNGDVFLVLHRPWPKGRKIDAYRFMFNISGNVWLSFNSRRRDGDHWMTACVVRFDIRYHSESDVSALM
jgi:hypothetical protein